PRRHPWWARSGGCPPCPAGPCAPAAPGRSGRTRSRKWYWSRGSGSRNGAAWQRSSLRQRILTYPGPGLLRFKGNDRLDRIFGSDRRAVLPNDRHWVGTWAAAPAPAAGVVGFNNHTLRMNPRISLGGERLRVRISNAYGNRPLVIGAAQIAVRDKGPAIVADTGRKLSFGGSESAVIAAGAVLFSDPVEL